MNTQEAEQPLDINELFHRDPMDLADDDISNIIAEYRRKRAMFQAGPAQGPKARAPAKPQTDTAKAAAGLKLDLDLGLKL